MNYSAVNLAIRISGNATTKSKSINSITMAFSWNTEERLNDPHWENLSGNCDLDSNIGPVERIQHII